MSWRPTTRPSSLPTAATWAPTSSARSAARSSTVVRSRTSWRGLARPSLPHGDGFATPDELRSALAEAAPAAAHEVRGSSVGLGVPPLHGQHREPVAHGVRAGRAVDEREGRGERSVRIHGVVDTELVGDAERRDVAPRSSSIVRRRFTWTISSPVTATSPSAARCRRGPRGRCRDVGVRRAVSCPTRCDREAAGTAPRRGGTRGPVPGTRTRRGTGGGR